MTRLTTNHGMTYGEAWRGSQGGIARLTAKHGTTHGEAWQGSWKSMARQDRAGWERGMESQVHGEGKASARRGMAHYETWHIARKDKTHGKTWLMVRHGTWQDIAQGKA